MYCYINRLFVFLIKLQSRVTQRLTLFITIYWIEAIHKQQGGRNDFYDNAIS